MSFYESSMNSPSNSKKVQKAYKDTLNSFSSFFLSSSSNDAVLF